MTHDSPPGRRPFTTRFYGSQKELRQRDPNVALPFYVSEIVMAAETARENESSG